jgi:hypothetical protein
MKMVNLPIQVEAWRAAKAVAAMHNTSLTGLVRAHLVARTRGNAPVWDFDASRAGVLS